VAKPLVGTNDRKFPIPSGLIELHSPTIGAFSVRASKIDLVLQSEYDGAAIVLVDGDTTSKPVLETKSEVERLMYVAEQRLKRI
jgi:hypothetical protein